MIASWSHLYGPFGGGENVVFLMFPLHVGCIRHMCMYIRLLVHMHMGMGRCMHVSMYISNMSSHFRMATEIWSMYMMISPMNGKGTPIQHAACSPR